MGCPLFIRDYHDNQTHFSIRTAQTPFLANTGLVSSWHRPVWAVRISLRPRKQACIMAGNWRVDCTGQCPKISLFSPCLWLCQPKRQNATGGLCRAWAWLSHAVFDIQYVCHGRQCRRRYATVGGTAWHDGGARRAVADIKCDYHDMFCVADFW